MQPQYRLYRRIIGYTVAGMALLFFSWVMFVIWVDMPPGLDDLENPDNKEHATIVYSVDGKLLGSYFKEENRIYVSLREVPRHAQDALVYTEDIRFYQHSGIDLIGLTNAVLSLFTRDVRGGSTLTQQLARNLYDKEVGFDRSIVRKLKEMIVAVYLERVFTKPEILERYLNTVPWGGTYFGIQAASMHYFNKNCKELEPHESALLIAMLKGPSYYNPRRFPNRAKARRDLILSILHENKKLTRRDYLTLKGKDLGVTRSFRQAHNEGPAPYFREYLRHKLKKWCDSCEVRITKNGKQVCPRYDDGLRVYTTINSRLQAHAEAAMREHLAEHQALLDAELKVYKPWEYDTSIIERAMRASERFNVMKGGGMTEAEIRRFFKSDSSRMRVFDWKNGQPSEKDTLLTPWDSLIYYSRFLEPGIVSIDQNNGHVLAWVGGIDHEYFQYDHVEKGQRQAGSVFKPFVYATAYDNNYSPCQEMPNSRITIVLDEGKPSRKEWTPRNYDGSYGDGEMMSLRKALAMSVNIVTARLMDQVQAQTVVEYARKLGITSPLEAYPSIALGSFDLKVVEVALAYAALANERGIWHDMQVITRIEDKHGNVLKHFATHSREALSPETAYVMKEALRSVVLNGTGAGIHSIYKLPWEVYAAGKTGTTQNNSDGWFVGFTPYLTTAVWVGCSDRSVHFRSVNGQGGRMALPIWAKYMKRAYEDSTLGYDPKRNFKHPGKLKVETDCAKWKAKNSRHYQGEDGGSEYDRYND